MGVNALTNFFSTLSGAIIIIITIAGAVIGIIALLLDYRNDRRARDTFSIERRRLTEVNVRVKHYVRVAPIKPHLQTPPPAQPPPNSDAPKTGAYVALHLPLKNIGDGPIDILGMLASGRVLSYAEWERGIGTRSRDVEWSDYKTYYWNSDFDPSNLFSGISTTKHLINQADNYTRFAARESGLMRRIDAVRDADLFKENARVPVMYRLFTVARGYSLGEILRQLGGGPPDPALNVTTELLQFQRLAQPNYHRWLCVQQALINLNRFAFRLAIYDPENKDESADPLGMLADPDAWRVFLLHHWEFVDDIDDAAPRDLSSQTKPTLIKMDDHTLLRSAANQDKIIIPRKSMDKANDKAKEFYSDLSLPDNWQKDKATLQHFDNARAACRELLPSYIAAWDRLKDGIAQCKDTTSLGKTPRKALNENYPRLIHLNEGYKDRWLALMKEGYLVSKPFPRNRLRINLRIFNIQLVKLGLLGRKTNYNEKDIPADPRVLEPYVMRTYYFLESVGLVPEKNDEKDKPED